MSEVKFACPVCGQHITADSIRSGGQLECPTCFRKVVIPQASSRDSKFILSAAEVSGPRPVSTLAQTATTPIDHGSKTSMIAAIVLGCVVVAVGSGLFIFRDKIFKPKPPPQEEVKKKEPAKIALAPIKVNPIPTNISWSMDLKELAFPDSPAAGSIHGSGFALDRAILQGGNLTLRQGKSGPPELGLTVQFFAQQGEELAGKSVEITPDRAPPVPKVTLRFRDDQNQESRKPINSGYALRVTFSEVANGHLPGKIFICLPDENKSFVAGTFDAELKKPNPPKPKQPKQPKK